MARRLVRGGMSVHVIEATIGGRAYDSSIGSNFTIENGVAFIGRAAAAVRI